MKSFLQTQALENTCSVTNDIEPSFAILYIFVVESSRKQYVNYSAWLFFIQRLIFLSYNRMNTLFNQYSPVPSVASILQILMMDWALYPENLNVL